MAPYNVQEHVTVIGQLYRETDTVLKKLIFEIFEQVIQYNLVWGGLRFNK
jgi:hypothetical protein